MSEEKNIDYFGLIDQEVLEKVAKDYVIEHKAHMISNVKDIKTFFLKDIISVQYKDINRNIRRVVLDPFGDPYQKCNMGVRFSWIQRMVQALPKNNRVPYLKDALAAVNNDLQIQKSLEISRTIAEIDSKIDELEKEKTTNVDAISGVYAMLQDSAKERAAELCEKYLPEEKINGIIEAVDTAIGDDISPNHLDTLISHLKEKYAPTDTSDTEMTTD